VPRKPSRTGREGPGVVSLECRRLSGLVAKPLRGGGGRLPYLRLRRTSLSEMRQEGSQFVPPTRQAIPHSKSPRVIFKGHTLNLGFSNAPQLCVRAHSRPAQHCRLLRVL